MRVWHRVLIGLVLVAPLPATTLQQVTLDDMIQKSTAIVRARVTGSRTASHGSDIYTHFQLQVLENWKGRAIAEVAVPGGVMNGVRQSVTGAPVIKTGQEYVLFLWTSRSGLTQVIGLSQGLFDVSEEGSGGVVARRPPASELMLDQSGNPVEDRPVSIRLQELRARVLRALGAAK
jgi:hypothetical protein